MKTVKINAPAKINLALNVLGVKDGYHELDMLVTTISLFDVITLSERKDDKITLKVHSDKTDYFFEPENDNAYKTAKLYMETFSTHGVDIKLVKRIPVGGGLGGSSADIAGVLRGMEKIYGVGGDLKPLADKLGSDSGYLLSGGYKRLKGRGEVVIDTDITKRLYLAMVTADGGVNTAKCFKEYDLSGDGRNADVDRLIEFLEKDDDSVYGIPDTGNALYPSAVSLNSEIERAYDEINSLSPRATVMSGSGSTVYGVFQTEELAKWAVDKLKRKFDNVYYSYTAESDEIDKIIF